MTIRAHIMTFLVAAVISVIVVGSMLTICVYGRRLANEKQQDGELQSRAAKAGNPKSRALIGGDGPASEPAAYGDTVDPKRGPVTADTEGQPRADEASRSLKLRGGVAQSGKSDGTPRVAGSNPAAVPSFGSRQVVRQEALNLSSAGSNPASRSNSEGVTDAATNITTIKHQPIHPSDPQAVRGGDDRSPADFTRVLGIGSAGDGAPPSLRRAGGTDVAEGGGEPWENVTDQPWMNRRTVPTAVTRPRSMKLASAGTSAGVDTTAAARADCRPSADTSFSPSAAAWIAKANAWADSIAAKYPRSTSIFYDRLRCNGSIPFAWYMATHNPINGLAFSDETPVEWMCRAGMDSPLAAMVVRTAPVMRPRGGPYVSVLITYNNQDVRIRIDEGEYAGCGVAADKPCVFRATFPCVYPMEKMYDDGRGGPMAVVSGWDVYVPGRIHPRAEKE